MCSQKLSQSVKLLLCFHQFEFKSYDCKYLIKEVEEFPVSSFQWQTQIHICESRNDVTGGKRIPGCAQLHIKCEVRACIVLKTCHRTTRDPVALLHARVAVDLRLHSQQSQEKKNLKIYIIIYTHAHIDSVHVNRHLPKPLLMYFSYLRRVNPLRLHPVRRMRLRRSPRPRYLPPSALLLAPN